MFAEDISEDLSDDEKISLLHWISEYWSNTNNITANTLIFFN